MNPCLALVCTAFLVAVPLVAKAAPAPLGPPGLAASAFPAPDRPVAGVVSPIWDEESRRDRAGEVDAVVRHLGIRPGTTVADIGAGSGYYASRLSRIVGPEGRVLAQDITPSYLARLEARMRREKRTNVSVGLGEPHDPRLPPASIDVALLVHMYHEVSQPFGLLHNLMPALRPGARVGIVDLDAPTAQHGTPRALLTCELAAMGYREVANHPLGASGYLAVFEPPAVRPEPGSIRPCTSPRQR